MTNSVEILQIPSQKNDLESPYLILTLVYILIMRLLKCVPKTFKFSYPIYP